MKKLFYLVDSKTNKTIPVEAIREGQGGQWRSHCGQCKGSDRTVTINDKLNIFHCSRCGWNGAIDNLDQSKQPATDQHSIGTDQNNLSLHPDHLVNLRKSGLSDETIREAGIYSVPPSNISKKLEGYFQNVKSLLAFPYPGSEGYERYKLFPSQQTERGTVKYYQKSGSPCRLYIPSKVVAILPDASIPIYFTEGEKKTLKAIQGGLSCIGLGGLWNWSDGSEEKNLIPDFDKIEWTGRTVYLIPDNDWEHPDRHGKPKNLREAVDGLAYRLIDRGAKVLIVGLPEGPLKGLDDFLCQLSIDEFHALPKHPIKKETIEEMIQGGKVDTLPRILKRLAGELMESQREPYITMIKERFGIPKAQLRNDIAKFVWEESREQERKEEKGEVDIDRLLESGANPEDKFSAQNFIGGILSFGAILDRQRILVQSNGEIISADGTNDDSFRFKNSGLTVEAIKRYRAGEDVDGKDLLNRIRTLFADHVIFRDDRIPTLLGVWTLGTYFFKVFRYYGYVWVNSPVKRCAKSRVLHVLSPLCFNSTKRLVNPSPASVFREVDRNDRTLIIDEVESLGSTDKDQKSELIGLLNAGFERDGQAPRMEKKDGEFISTYFNVYSPKALAGIKSIVDTIEDRSFKIRMERKKKSENVKRFNLRVLDSHIKKIQEDCHIWALRYAGEVSEVYDEAMEFPGTQDLDDRMKDILEPLLSIAYVIQAQTGEKEIVSTLITLAREMGKGREDSELLNGSILAVVNLMKGLLDGAEDRFISADELYNKFQKDEDLDFVKSKKGLAFFLSRLDIHRTKPVWNKLEGKTVRGYNVTRKWVEDLESRYI